MSVTSNSRCALLASGILFGGISLGLAQEPLHTTSSSPKAQLLNSERIEATFGSYGIDVIRSDAELRISSLHSLSAGQKVTRTYAIVRYPRVVDPSFATEHQLILNGGSIGATFRDHGWAVMKTHRFFGEIPKSKRLDEMMGGANASRFAIHIYVFEIAKDAVRHQYAVIAEVHHPSYLGLRAVIEAYAPGWAGSDPYDELAIGMLGATIAESR